MNNSHKILVLIFLCSMTLSMATCGMRNRHARNAGEEDSQYLKVRFEGNESLQQFLGSIREFYGMRAIAAAVIRADSVVESVQVGFTLASQNDQSASTEYVRISGGGQTMTAMVTAALVEEGVLSWQTTPLDVFPDMAQTINPAFHTITLEDILAHRAGIMPFHADALPFLSSLPLARGTVQEQRRFFAKWLLQQNPYADPGVYEYSNAGYALAGAMLEEVSGQTWESLIQERLFAPLGLATAGPGWPVAGSEGDLWRSLPEAVNIYSDQEEVYSLPKLFAPAGDIHLSIDDYIAYAQLHLQGLRGRGRLLRAETYTHLHTPIGAPGVASALGWIICSHNGDTFSEQQGGVGTFHTIMSISHTHDFACVVCTQLAGKRGADACRNVEIGLINTYLQGDVLRSREVESIYEQILQVLDFLWKVNLRRGFELLTDFIKDLYEKHIHGRGIEASREFSVHYR